MAMNAALSGLQAAQKDIDATSHNIANVGTTGFRASRVLFADVFSTSPENMARTAVGSGAQVTSVNQDFTQGPVQATGRPLDLSIEGAGFFAVQLPAETNGTAGQTLYTRSGDFSLDSEGTLTNTAGNIVLGWPVSDQGGALSQSAANAGPLSVPFSMGETAASSAVSMDVTLPASPTALGGQTAVPPAGSFDPADSTSWAYRSPVGVVGSDGKALEAEVYFSKLTTPTTDSPETQWQANLVVDGEVLGCTAPTATFGADGSLTSDMPLAFTSVTGQDLTLDLTGTALDDTAFAVNSASADGSTAFKMTALEVDSSGTLWATYGAGDPVAQGQLMLATFSNPQGLMQTGSSSFAATNASGQPLVGSAESAGFGKMRSGGLEGSNVDLTVELVDLITAQRNYQASAKALETSSSLMKTIMNLST